MDELGSGHLQPLAAAHHEAQVRLTSGAQIRQSTGCAAEQKSKLSPRKTAMLTLQVECGVEFVQIPAEPTVGSRLRQPGVAHVEYGAAEELLGRPAEPAQYEESVLTRGRVTRAQSCDCTASKRMIGAVGVELRRLLPELVGKLVPAQPPLTTAAIERSEECCEVEHG